jgi:Tfp pilus assembly protein PilN
VRPVNLIPLEERRGAARGPAGPTSPVRVYILLGALGAALLCVLALVLTTNKINSKTEELAKVQTQEQGIKQVADALRPYGQFADLEQARETEISGLVSSRFNWERALRQLSQAIPSNVWIVNLAATVSPAVEVEGGGGGDTASLREKTQAPAFGLTGCTWSHHAVARMMVRMQNLDDVTRVRLAKSAREESSAGGAVAATAPQTSNNQPQASGEDSTGCTGSARLTKFDILVEFGGGTGADAGVSADAGGVPSGAAAPLAQAQAAGQQAQASSSAAQSQAASSTGGGQ